MAVWIELDGSGRQRYRFNVDCPWVWERCRGHPARECIETPNLFVCQVGRGRETGPIHVGPRVGRGSAQLPHLRPPVQTALYTSPESGLLDRLEVGIKESEAQNDGGEEASPANLPEELSDKEALREQVRQAVRELTGQEARIMRTPVGITLAYNPQTMTSPAKKANGEKGRDDDHGSGLGGRSRGRWAA